jgi:glycosyltransferase involved in cell wall biosynthesis
MIRVGVDAWNLPDDRRGIGRYLRTTLAVLRADYAGRIACTLVIPEWPARFNARRYHAELPAPPYPIISRRVVTSREIDVMWFPFNGPSYRTFPRPAVATLHDAHPFVIEGLGERAKQQFHDAAAWCDALVTDSAYSQGELARALALDPHRIDVIPLGVAPFPAGTPSLDPSSFGRYVFFVGETSHRKGIDTLVDAMRLLAQRGIALRLVLAGRVAGALPNLDGIDAHVLGHVDDVTLGALFRHCAVFAFPSRAEGFGLPVLEAMLARAPVVASTASSLPEVGGDAALYVPPDDPAALGDQIARIVSDDALAADLRERGVAHASTMTWQRSTAALVAVFERVLRR